ncbi:MAG TPA: cytochrome c [Candidatus Limnocylindria bacterium]
MTISRQGFEQMAIALAIGILIFALLALRQWRRGGTWRRPAIAGGAMAAVAAIALALGYTVAPNIPTPPVPFTARFAQDPTPDTTDTRLQGKAIFQARCAVCHGAQGKGDGPAALTLIPRPVNLQVHVPLHAPGEIEYWIGEGVPGTGMPPWKTQLSETERWQVVRYLQALAAGTAP